MTAKELKQIGRNIKAAREAKGMTQAVVAKKCRITTNYYARIERGECQFTFTVLRRLVRTLDISSSQVLPF
ncbi:helix-turn-helix transcriptional regulator [Candidatus Saccharibacteria bacterium]|nr:helix-turn-helix transcriptional regulator [Candidatus Saccharibacteria bacterium]